MARKGLPPAVGDYGLLLAVCTFAALVSGPSAMIVLSAAFLHFFVAGQPRLSMLPLYIMLVPAYYGTKKAYITAVSDATVLYGRIAVAAAVAISLFADRYILPYGGKVLKPTGRYATAMLLVHVQRATRAADFMCRVYYPTLPKKGADKLTYLLFGKGVAEGIAKFMNMSSWLLSWLAYTEAWCYDADPTTAAPVAAAGQDTGLPVPQGRLPVMILSHGLASSADLHASLINELCSRGWVVMAPDHADGTAAYTQFDDGYRMWYQPLTSEQKKDRGLEWKRRHEQLRSRTRELAACVDLACELATEDGMPPVVTKAAGKAKAKATGPKLDSKLRVEDDGGDDSARPEEGAVDPETEADDMKLLRIMLGGKIAAYDGTPATAGSGGVGPVLTGHSFGGASVLAAAESDTRVAAVVGMDPWAFPLTAATLSRGIPNVPVCAMVCDDWAVWRENDVGMKLLLDKEYRAKHAGKDGRPVVAGTLAVKNSNGIAKDGSVNAAFAVEDADRVHGQSTYLALRDTRHQSFTDLAVLAESVMRWNGNIGRQPAKDQVAMVREAITTYPAWVINRKLTGTGPAAFVPTAKLQSGLVDREKLQHNR